MRFVMSNFLVHICPLVNLIEQIRRVLVGTAQWRPERPAIPGKMQRLEISMHDMFQLTTLPMLVFEAILYSVHFVHTLNFTVELSRMAVAP